MERLRKSLVLVLVAGLPAAAPPLDTVSPDFCVAAGSMTYRLARNAAPTDYRVRIDDKAPDLRIALADRAETADFTLVDEPGSAPYSCRGAGFVKSVTIVPADTPADMTISLTRDPATADFTLFVHSTRLSSRDAAALFVLMRAVDLADTVGSLAR